MTRGVAATKLSSLWTVMAGPLNSASSTIFRAQRRRPVGRLDTAPSLRAQRLVPLPWSASLEVDVAGAAEAAAAGLAVPQGDIGAAYPDHQLQVQPHDQPALLALRDHVPAFAQHVDHRLATRAAIGDRHAVGVAVTHGE